MKKKVNIKKLSFTKEIITDLNSYKIVGGDPLSVPMGSCSHIQTQCLGCDLGHFTATLTTKVTG